MTCAADAAKKHRTACLCHMKMDLDHTYIHAGHALDLALVGHKFYKQVLDDRTRFAGNEHGRGAVRGQQEQIRLCVH